MSQSDNGVQTGCMNHKIDKHQEGLREYVY